MKSLKESIFDDFEKISNDTDTVLALENIYKNWASGSSMANLKKCADTLGRKLNIGDLVIVGISSGDVMTGRVMDIDKKKGHKQVAVSLKGDGSDITITYGKYKGQFNQDDYYNSCDLLKIDANILKLITQVK